LTGHDQLAAAQQQQVQAQVQQSSQQQRRRLLPLQATQLSSSRQPLRGLSSSFIAAATQQAHKQQLGEQAAYVQATHSVAVGTAAGCVIRGQRIARQVCLALKAHAKAAAKLPGEHAVFSQTAVQLTMQALMLLHSILQEDMAKQPLLRSS
jgi:hypothetical protein